MDISIEGGQVVIKATKCLIALTKAEFLQALKRGKAFRRREQMAQRLARLPQEPRSVTGEGGELG